MRLGKLDFKQARLREDFQEVWEQPAGPQEGEIPPSETEGGRWGTTGCIRASAGGGGGGDRKATRSQVVAAASSTSEQLQSACKDGKQAVFLLVRSSSLSQNQPYLGGATYSSRLGSAGNRRRHTHNPTQPATTTHRSRVDHLHLLLRGDAPRFF